MNSRLTITGVLLAAGQIATLPAQAALHARDLNSDSVTDAYYDTVLDITWLADANLAATNTFGLSTNTNLGDHPDDSYGPSYDEIIYLSGRLNWGAALHWIDAMNRAEYLGYSDWRLPHVSPINGNDFIHNYSVAGDTDHGYNISAPATAYVGSMASELAFMFYQNLANPGYFTPAGVASGCVVSWPSDTCLDNVGPFYNIQPHAYWFGEDYSAGTGDVWYFYMVDGYQYVIDKNAPFYAWAVRPGDVAVVPEPQTYALLLTGLGVVGWQVRRRA